jgi:hypothetical protein
MKTLRKTFDVCAERKKKGEKRGKKERRTTLEKSRPVSICRDDDDIKIHRFQHLRSFYFIRHSIINT